MMFNLIKQCNSGWKMTPFDAKLVSNKPCFYHEIFFAAGTRVSWKNKKSVYMYGWVELQLKLDWDI